MSIEYLYLSPETLAEIDRIVTDRLLCQYAGMPGLRIVEAPVPADTAYLMKPPSFTSFNFVEFVDPPEFEYEPFKLRVIQDMGVRLHVPRSLILTTDVGERLDAPPRRVPDLPARDFTFWEALVLVAVGVIVLLLLARATG